MSDDPSRRRRTFAEVDAVVRDYQAGIEGASDELVSSFEGFIVKFLNLINKGEVNLNNTVLRNFIGLFTKARVHQCRHNPSIRREVYATINMIKDEMAQFDRDDIKNELIVCFLGMARRYKSHDDNPYFHTYIQKAFHYNVARQLKTLTKDSLTYLNGDKTLSYDDNGTYEYPNEEYGPSTRCAVTAAQHEDTYLIDETLESDESYLDENWINGATCSDSFGTLTVLDRRILKLYYVDGLEDQQIADKLNVCRATVNRRRLASEQQLYREHSGANQLRSDADYIAVVRQKAGARAKTEVSRRRAEEEAVQRAGRLLKRWWKADGR